MKNSNALGSNIVPDESYFQSYNNNQIYNNKEYIDGERITYLLSYLEILQHGRAKPAHNGGTIRESLDNIAEIDAVKFQLNDLLGLPTISLKSNNITKQFKK